MHSLYDEMIAAWHAIRHRRWLGLGVAWTICLLGWLVVALIPNAYESHARIFVQLDDALEEQLKLAGGRKRNIERVRQTLASAVNLEKVVRSTRIGEDIDSPKELEEAVLEMAKDIKVVSHEDNLFEITAQSNERALSDAENAQLARDIVQKLIDIFREENLAGGRGMMNESLEFMNQQLAERQAALEAAEQKRMDFEAQHPELANGGSGLIQRLEAVRAELRGIEADLAAARSALAAISGQLSGTPQTLPGVGAAGGMRGALAQAMSELAGMRGRGMTENHPDVIALKNQIAQLRLAAQNEPAGAAGLPNPAYSSLQSIRAEREANMQALLSRRASLQAELAGLTGAQASNPAAAAEAQRITRDYDVLKQQYDKMLADREALRLRGQVETERSAIKFQVIDPPTTPRAPVAPNRPLLLAGVLLVGLGAGAGSAFAVGQLRNTFATTARLEKAIGLPVLGAISTTLTAAGRALQRKRSRQFLAASAGLAGLFVLLLIAELIQVGMVA